MGRSNKSRYEGALIAIPTKSGLGLAKVISYSSYFKDVMLLKIYEKCIDSVTQTAASDFDGSFFLRYSRAQTLKEGGWKVLFHEEVDEAERALTKRTSGGEIWIEDQHLGPANDHDLAKLPKMLVHGERLIEKLIEGYNQ